MPDLFTFAQNDILMRIRPIFLLTFVAFFFLILIRFGWAQSIAACNASLSDKYPNILNYKGIPKTSSDRNVFMFSDLGAWYDYALPSDSINVFSGSIVGPFIMSPNNGIWLSKCLAMLKLIDKNDSYEISFANASIIANNIYPDRLEQILKIEKPELEIKITLIFVTNRSALIRVIVTNQGSSPQNMMRPDLFQTYIPFPTLAASNPKFAAENGYWRGPMWIDQVYFAIGGLKNYGYHEDVTKYTLQIMDRLDGLKNSDLPSRENYNPPTGEGLEAMYFSWSAAHL